MSETTIKFKIKYIKHLFEDNWYRQGLRSYGFWEEKHNKDSSKVNQALSLRYFQFTKWRNWVSVESYRLTGKRQEKRGFDSVIEARQNFSGSESDWEISVERSDWEVSLKLCIWFSPWKICEFLIWICNRVTKQ